MVASVAIADKPTISHALPGLSASRPEPAVARPLPVLYPLRARRNATKQAQRASDAAGRKPGARVTYSRTSHLGTDRQIA